MTTRQLPRLGDRGGLVIEATRGAVTMYRLGVDDSMSTADAERDLVDDIREAYVTSSVDRLMTVRYRNRSRRVDVIASLTRLSPDHVRVDDVQVRSVKSSERTSGRSSDEGLVHRIAGAGSVRVRHDTRDVEWRDRGSSDWQPASMQALARDYDAGHHVWQWLRRHGITRPSPSGPTVPEADREAKQCLLRLRPETIARLDALAERWGITRSEAVTRLVDRER